MIGYIDSHAHITSDELYPEVDLLLARAQSAGVQAVVNVCTDAATLQRGIALAKRYPWVYNAAATHPHDAAKERDNTDPQSLFSIVENHAKNGDLVAIGEIGLDYHYHHSDAATQQNTLRSYFQLALKYSLPVIIHCREAFADFFSILDTDYTTNRTHAPGVLHCFTGTAAEAEEVLKRGWYLSISGIVTFKKSEELRAIAKMTPLDRLLIETDAPFLAPQSHRGKTNEPSFVTETAAVIAAAKGISTEEVAKATAANAIRLFKLRNTLS